MLSGTAPARALGHEPTDGSPRRSAAKVHALWGAKKSPAEAGLSGHREHRQLHARVQGCRMGRNEHERGKKHHATAAPNRLHGDAHRRERRGTEREGDNSRNGKVEARGPTCRVKCSRQRASKTSTIHLGGRVPLSISRLSCIARRQIPSAKTPMVAIGDGYGPEGVAVPGRERERRRVARGHRL